MPPENGNTVVNSIASTYDIIPAAGRQTADAAPRYTASHQGALRRFAIAISALTVLGHAALGFEQSYAQPCVALGVAYLTQLLLETIEAWARGRRPRYAGGFGNLVDFLLSAHISALAVAMLLYYSDRLLVVAFASAVSIASKTLMRAPLRGRWRHFLNPSNCGITVTLLLFPSVGLLPPWQFTENVGGFLDVLLPLAILSLGTFLHVGYAKRLSLVGAWLIGFVLQALIRAILFDNSFLASIAPMTGVAFVLFTFYMVPDPATTPDGPLAQAIFGFVVAVVYGVLMSLHLAFGLFLALTIVCSARGIGLYLTALTRHGPKKGSG